MNFDEAREKAEAMVDEESISPDTTQATEASNEAYATEQQAEQFSDEEQMTMENAVNTAEQAAQVASEKNVELQEALQGISELKEQNEVLQKTIAEMSNQQKEAVIDEAMEVPKLDVADLSFADEETISKAQEDYAKRMFEFVKTGVMKDLEPYIETVKEGMYQKEKNDVVSALSQELGDFESKLPWIENIIASDKALSTNNDMSLQDKYTTAYLMAKGVESMNTPEPTHKEPTAEEFMELYEKNPEFQELIEKKRIGAVKQNQQVPLMSASNGAGNVALNIKEKPKNFDEAFDFLKTHI